MMWRVVAEALGYSILQDSPLSPISTTENLEIIGDHSDGTNIHLS